MNVASKKPNDILRHQRQLRSWTLQEVADKLYDLCKKDHPDRGINADIVGRWERGVAKPSAYYQAKLTTLFDMPPDQLGLIEHAQPREADGQPSPVALLTKEQLESLNALLALERNVLTSGGDAEEQESITTPAFPGNAITDRETQAHRTQIRDGLNERRPTAPKQQILGPSHDTLAQYLLQQRMHLFNALAPGSTNLRVGDVVGQKGLFISLPWEEMQGIPALTNLGEYLIDTLIKGQRTLLLGNAGQGKTTVLKHVFTLMVDRYIDGDEHHPTIPLPLYIPLRAFPFYTGNGLEALWSYLAEDFPLSFEDFAALVRKKQIVFLFDGFDEIKGELTQRFINHCAANKMFTYPSILSCRKSFFEFYLSMTTLQECYPQWIELQSLALNRSIIQYITAFCERKQKKMPHKSITSPTKIIAIIRDSQELQDLAARPLLLIMMLDLFTDPREMHEGEWSVTKLYKKYTEKWLKNEAAKSDSLLRWHEKAMLVQEIAWLTYIAKSSVSSSYRLSQNDTFTQRELSFFVKQAAARYPHLTASQLLDDLCFRTFLALSEGDRYYFLHKTFQEYYVATYIYEQLASRERDRDAIAQLLQEFLPFEIATFLKQMLEAKDTPFSEKDVVVDNLLKVYQNRRGDDLQSVAIRQHASHYLTLVKTKQAVQFLETAWIQEPNKWVQRGIMVGLALYCERPEILEQYIKIIREDAEAASINLGYHLVYYGDQIPEAGYHDQGSERCDGTLQAILRHLKNERHRNSWVLDMVTLSALLEKRGMSILFPHKEDVPFLKEFLNTHHQKDSDLFQQEQKRLAKRIGEIAP